MFFFDSTILERGKKLYKTTHYNGVGWIGNPTFQTACGLVGFSTQPNRCVTFLCIPLYIGYPPPSCAQRQPVFPPAEDGGKPRACLPPSGNARYFIGAAIKRSALFVRQACHHFLPRKKSNAPRQFLGFAHIKRGGECVQLRFGFGGNLQRVDIHREH